MTFSKEQVQQALEKSWTKLTSRNPDEWSPENPARGQCAVSALIVQDILGGELQKVETNFNGKIEGHFRNISSAGNVIDTTRSQYPKEQEFEPRDINLRGYSTAREKLLADDDTRKRYETLKARMLKQL